MPWTWRYEKSDGTVTAFGALPEAIFASQGDAESWLGENWRGLLDAGVDQVTLLDDGKVEYGPMSLRPADLTTSAAGQGGLRKAPAYGPACPLARVAGLVRPSAHW